ncbi:hypothetical protein K458DRAFT_190279 [Lentithecium fluviatile CBS 122367]|uniref:Uncharacterized protein n=1 Tax=Lentithecium fluviatile CBS 122367 TaxID=1168545 RepID=A0A6G1JA21_9PLEO|nr:hypothetical protein K458DRAFT_190279 [Lentithecium fluviatile CBS 122367]
MGDRYELLLNCSRSTPPAWAASLKMSTERSWRHLSISHVSPLLIAQEQDLQWGPRRPLTGFFLDRHTPLREFEFKRELVFFDQAALPVILARGFGAGGRALGRKRYVEPLWTQHSCLIGSKPLRDAVVENGCVWLEAMAGWRRADVFRR